MEERRNNKALEEAVMELANGKRMSLQAPSEDWSLEDLDNFMARLEDLRPASTPLLMLLNKKVTITDRVTVKPMDSGP